MSNLQVSAEDENSPRHARGIQGSMRTNVFSESRKKILGLFNMIGLLVLIIPSVKFGRPMKILNPKIWLRAALSAGSSSQSDRSVLYQYGY